MIVDEDLFAKFWSLKENADRFLVSKRGAYLRMGLLAATVGAYPIIKIISTGPLVSAIFRWKVNVDYELPEHVRKTINEQKFRWLEKEGRNESETFIQFGYQKDAYLSLDSVRAGSLSSPTGAKVALPFYVKFKSEDEARNFAKEHLEPFNVMGKVACIIWESDVGKQLLSTFILSEEALAFLIARDLYGTQDRYLLTYEGLTWFCYTFTYMACFYVLHQIAFKGNSLVFAVVFTLLFAFSYITAKNWNELAIYVIEHRSDMEAAKLSHKHTKGGKEFYMKVLTRNRLLRELIDGGDKLFTEAGDSRKAIAEYVVRFGEMEMVESDNDQLTLSIAGDDLPEDEGVEID